MADNKWKEIDVKNLDYGCLDGKINLKDWDFATIVLDYREKYYLSKNAKIIKILFLKNFNHSKRFIIIFDKVN